jgi:hypothetical protein
MILFNNVIYVTKIASQNCHFVSDITIRCLFQFGTQEYTNVNTYRSVVLPAVLCDTKLGVSYWGSNINWRFLRMECRVLRLIGEPWRRALTARYCIVESFMVCIIQVTKSRKIKWWGGVLWQVWRQDVHAGFCGETWGIDGMKVPTLIFKKWDGVGTWTGLFWLRIETSGGLLWAH